MAKEITLTRGMVALVDDEDYERLPCFRWTAVEGRRGSFYAHRAVRPEEGLGVQSRQMQRDVLDPSGVVPGSVRVDHINWNTLDCQKQNLRWADHSLSNQNRRLFLNNSTGYRGVYFDRKQGRWYAQIGGNGQRQTSHRLPTPEAAALAYNALAIERYGDAAQLNIVREHG